MRASLQHTEQQPDAAADADCDSAALPTAAPGCVNGTLCGLVYKFSGLHTPPKGMANMEHIYVYLLPDGYAHLTKRGASRPTMLANLPRMLQSVEFQELWASSSCKPEHLQVHSDYTGLNYYHPLAAGFLLRRLFPVMDVATMDLFCG